MLTCWEAVFSTFFLDFVITFDKFLQYVEFLNYSFFYQFRPTLYSFSKIFQKIFGAEVFIYYRFKEYYPLYSRVIAKML